MLPTWRLFAGSSFIVDVMSRRGSHFVSGDLKSIVYTRLVLSRRLAVHKQSFLNLLKQNGRRVTKVYSAILLPRSCIGEFLFHHCSEISHHLLARFRWFNFESLIPLV